MFRATQRYDQLSFDEQDTFSRYFKSDIDEIRRMLKKSMHQNIRVSSRYSYLQFKISKALALVQVANEMTVNDCKKYLHRA